MIPPMEHYLKSLVLWTYYHPHWAGVVVFLIALGESIPVIGTIVPGSVVMTAIGALIGAGILPAKLTIALASLGAFVGDGLGYTAGYVLKSGISKIWPFSTHPSWLMAGRAFFDRHGKKSVFIARFIGPVRAFMPITAGALHMPPRQFFPTDCLSAICWAILYMLPGILMGAFSLDLPPDLALHFIWVLLMTLVIILLAYWLLRFIAYHVSDILTNMLNHIWQQWTQQKKHRLLTYLLRHHHKNTQHGQLGLFFCLSISVILFIVLSIQIALSHSNLEMNHVVYHLFRSLRNLPSDILMVIISWLGDKKVLLIPLATGGLWLLYQRCYRACLHWFLLFFFTGLVLYVFKTFLPSPRPTGLAVSLSHLSFPSGHVTFSTAMYGFVAYLAASRWPINARWQSYTTAIVIVLAIMLSRVYLGAHWLTDIVGGTLLGISLLLITIIAYEHQTPQRIRPMGFLLSLILGLMLAVGWHVKHELMEKVAAYQPVWSKQTITLEDWWSHNGNVYPMYQVNRFGQPVKALNIQWAGDIAHITKTLEDNGWHKPVPFNWVTGILHPELSHKYALHVKTALFQDREPVIVLIKPISSHQTLLLRLWQTHIQFTHSTQLLWAGTLTIHTDTPHPLTVQDYQKLSRNTLVQALSSIPEYQIQTKLIELESHRLFHLPNHGELILIKPEHSHSPPRGTP